MGIIGEFQSGKSLLINCLLRRSIATVGEGVATTHTVVNYRYAYKANEHFVYRRVDGKLYDESIEKLHEQDKDESIACINVFLKDKFLKDYELIDIPGFGANATDSRTAKGALRDIDFALLIVSNDKAIGVDSDTFKELQELRTYNIPYYFILNCINFDRWNCRNGQNIDIAERDLELLDFYKPAIFPLEENGINIVNLMWYWYEQCPPGDELIQREDLQFAFARYKIDDSVKHEVGQASNFSLINRIFDVDNRAFLELKRDLKEEIQRLKSELCPIGTIQAFAFNSIPEGWLPCDGRSLSMEEYPLLYKVIGKIYGSTSNGKYKLPNLCGRFIRGWDNTGEVDRNRVFGSKQDDSVQIHSHEFSASKLKVDYAGEHAHTAFADKEDVQKPSIFSSDITMLRGFSLYGFDEVSTPKSGNHTHVLTATSSPIGCPKKCEYNGAVRYSEETRPKNIALLFCIRYK